MSKPEITAYLKTHCGWSRGVRAVFEKYELPYNEKDIIQNPDYRFEMEQLSGQPLSPCVIINGTMLADISGEEVESYMVSWETHRSPQAFRLMPRVPTRSTPRW